MKEHKIETRIVELYLNKKINSLQKNLLLEYIHKFLLIYQKIYEKGVIEKSKIDGIIIDDVIDEIIMAALIAMCQKS
jgi:hypothetical protein